MVLLVAIHRVSDYEAWKQVFDEGRHRRQGLGVLRHWVYRSADDGNEVMVALELDSKESAERLMMSPDEVREWMDRAGVEVYPAVLVGEEAEHFDYASLGGTPG